MAIRPAAPAIICTLCLAAAPALAASLPARAPGLWQSTTIVTGPDGEPLPNAPQVVTVSCVDPATDLKFFLSNASACPNLSVAGSGGAYQISGTCNQGGQSVTISETLTYASPRAVTLTANLVAPTGPETITSQLQWQGQCLPGMMPGDEGTIVNGAFSKSDNINDPANP